MKTSILSFRHCLGAVRSCTAAAGVLLLGHAALASKPLTTFPNHPLAPWEQEAASPVEATGVRGKPTITKKTMSRTKTARAPKAPFPPVSTIPLGARPVELSEGDVILIPVQAAVKLFYAYIKPRTLTGKSTPRYVVPRPNLSARVIVDAPGHPMRGGGLRVLSPRRTAIFSRRPSFVWMPLPRPVSEPVVYHLTLNDRAASAPVWSINVENKTSCEFPAGKPDLIPDHQYWLSVSSNSPAQSTKWDVGEGMRPIFAVTDKREEIKSTLASFAAVPTENGEQFLFQARVYVAHELFADALVVLNKALSKNNIAGTSLLVRRDLECLKAAVLFATDDLDAAASCYAAIVNSTPKDAPELAFLYKAQAQVEIRRDHWTVEICDQLVKAQALYREQGDEQGVDEISQILRTQTEPLQGNVVGDRAALEQKLAGLEIEGRGSTEWAQTVNLLGVIALDQKNLADARNYFERLLTQDNTSGRALELAPLLDNLATATISQHDWASAQSYLTQILRLQEASDPNSQEVAETCYFLGVVTNYLRDLPQASNYLKRAIGIQRGASSPSLLDSLRVGGSVSFALKDLTTAQSYYEELVSLEQKKQPPPMGNSLVRDIENLCKIYLSQGKLATAAKPLYQCLRIRERTKSDEIELARVLYYLGLTQRRLGNIRAARPALERARQIQESKLPDSVDLAMTYTEIGSVFQITGQLSQARRWHNLALNILRRKAPGSVELSNVFVNLGLEAHARGSWSEAKQSYTDALAIQEKKPERPLDIAAIRQSLGLVALNQGHLDEAAEDLDKAQTIQRKLAPHSLGYASTLNGLAMVAHVKGDLTRTRELLLQATHLLDQAPESLVAANIYTNTAVVFKDLGDFNNAGKFIDKSIAILDKFPQSMAMAHALNDKGMLLAEEGDLAGAKTFYWRAKKIFDTQAPTSPARATLLDNIGRILAEEGDLTAGKNYCSEALALLVQQKRTDQEPAIIAILSNLGQIANSQGDLISALFDYQKATQLQRGLSDTSLDYASLLNKQGMVYQAEGDLEKGARLHLQALALQGTSAPNSIDVAATLNCQGHLCYMRGDLEAALQKHEAALAILKSKSPRSLATAVTLNNVAVITQELGKVRIERGLTAYKEFATAKHHYEAAIAIETDKAKDSLDRANTLCNLGSLLQDSGQDSRSSYEAAFEIRKAKAPVSLEFANSLKTRGLLALRENNVAAAKRDLSNAFALEKQLAPHSLPMAVTMNALAAVASLENQRQRAANYNAMAWRIVGRQGAMDNIPGDEAYQAFHQQWNFIGTDYMRNLHALGRDDEALDILEQGRAQSLLALLRTHGILQSLVPTQIWRLYQEAQTRLIFARRQLVLSAYSSNAKQSQAYQTYEKARVESEARWGVVVASARTALAKPLTPTQARGQLPSKTLVLEFAVTSREVFLFIARKDQPVKVFVLKKTAAELRKEVEQLEQGVEGIAEVNDACSRQMLADWENASQTLFNDLFAEQVQQALRAEDVTHVVISPDNFLWDVNFSSLKMEKSHPQFLGLVKALSYAQSLTLLVQCHASKSPSENIISSTLTASSSSSPILRDVIVGNPSLPVPFLPSFARPILSSRTNGELPVLLPDYSALDSLTDAEGEADDIARLYGTLAQKGDRATEKWLRAAMANARLIHIAAHIFFNAQMPLSSGILLAPPSGRADAADHSDDGLLQTWELFDMKVNADLVVLSGCDSGKGNATPEGLVGLTRAWQAAGARSVIVSQWKVNDKATRSLMVAFHKNFRHGWPKDEALRRAMLQIQSNPNTARPYYWAPFSIFGDIRNLRFAINN